MSSVKCDCAYPPSDSLSPTRELSHMAGADFCWMMHDYSLPLDRIPDTIARTVQLIVDDLRAAGRSGPRPPATAIP